MYKNQKILAVVTARGGSKGLPGKNIKVLNGKPLIGWTLEQIKASTLIDEAFVSTDSLEIAKVCEQFDVKVPSLRPEELARDNTSSMDVLEYTINLLEQQGKKFDYIMLLEPTSPLRKRGDLDNIVRLACDNPEQDGVISVGEVTSEHPLIMKRINENGNITPYVDESKRVYQRQQFDKVYFPYGVAYLVKVSKFKEVHTIYTDKVLPYYIERWQNYEIDDIYDFVCIESIMKLEEDKL